MVPLVIPVSDVLVTVIVDPSPNCVAAAKSNVVMVHVPEMVQKPVKVTLLYESAPGAKMRRALRVAPEICIVELFADHVRFVITAIFQIVPAAVDVKFQMPLPKFMVLVPVPLPEKAEAALNVTLLLFALLSNVPVNAPQVID